MFAYIHAVEVVLQGERIVLRHIRQEAVHPVAVALVDHLLAQLREGALH